MKSNKNEVKLLVAALVMVMVFAAVAVLVETSESDAAGSDITYLGGTVTGNEKQTFGPGSNVVEKDLVIPADKILIIGGKFTVNEGAELTIKGELVILLPVDEAGEPDYEFMEEYVKERVMLKSFSKHIQNRI